ncbi:MAG: hypothetical protein E7404_08785 [Ruminococcaceae bacterium]|nr:hypothetical protein [Oscillospiraceae bacterium]
MSFNPHTNGKNQIPDILSQAETIINNFITKPPKNKNNFKKTAFFICSVLVLTAFCAFLFAFLK